MWAGTKRAGFIFHRPTGQATCQSSNGLIGDISAFNSLCREKWHAGCSSAIEGSPAVARKHQPPLGSLIRIYLQCRIDQAGLTGKILVRCGFHASYTYFSYIGQKPFTLLETYALMPQPHIARRAKSPATGRRPGTAAGEAPRPPGDDLREHGSQDARAGRTAGPWEKFLPAER